MVRGEDRLWCTRLREGRSVVLLLHGDLELGTEPVLRAALDAALAECGPGDGLVVDLSGVDFCAARGLSVLIGSADACTRRRVPFTLRGCPAQVVRLLDLLGLRDRLGARDAGPRPVEW